MKKTKIDFNKIVVFLPIATALLTILFMLFSGVKYYKADGSLLDKFSGFNIIFGLTEVSQFSGVTTSAPILNFSVVAFLSILLPLCASLLQLLSNRLIKLVALVLSIGGVVLMFMLPSFIVFSTQALTVFYSYFAYHIGVGAIIGGFILIIQTIVIGYEILS